MKPRSLAITVSLCGLVHLLACQAFLHPNRPEPAVIRTDSTEIGVRFGGGAYFAKIGFTYVNETNGEVSQGGCSFPQWPTLQKKVGDRWVTAYTPSYLMCRSNFVIAARRGQTFHDVIQMRATVRGGELRVDPIGGPYRLRWNLAKGRDAYDDNARRIEAISNEFRMILRQ